VNGTNTKSLEQGLHELTQVVHPVGEATMDFFCKALVFRVPCLFEFLGHRRDECFGVDRFEALQQLIFGDEELAEKA
jgi:hypothetical protein